jgi:hypothetical protein
VSEAGPVDLLTELVDRLRGIAGVSEGPSRFVPGPAWQFRGREIAHLDESPDGALVLDVRLGRVVIRGRRDALRADSRITLRPRGSADWLVIAVRGPGDLAAAADLVADAVATYERRPTR